MSEVTNERKVSILEKLLLERDEQIRKLQEENTELEKKLKVLEAIFRNYKILFQKHKS